MVFLNNNDKFCNFDNSCGFCFALLYRAKIFCEALTQCVRQFLLVWVKDWIWNYYVCKKSLRGSSYADIIYGSVNIYESCNLCVICSLYCQYQCTHIIFFQVEFLCYITISWLLLSLRKHIQVEWNKKLGYLCNLWRIKELQAIYYIDFLVFYVLRGLFMECLKN